MIGDFLAVFFGEYFGYILVAVLVAGWLRKRRVRLFLEAGAAALLSRGIITESIRFFWHRNRPFVEQNIVPLIDHPASASFPSGHAALFFAIATVLYAHNKRLGILFFVGALAIGIARVLAHLHWPSDIAGGALSGIASGVAVIKLSQYVWRNR